MCFQPTRYNIMCIARQKIDIIVLFDTLVALPYYVLLTYFYGMTTTTTDQHRCVGDVIKPSIGPWLSGVPCVPAPGFAVASP